MPGRSGPTLNTRTISVRLAEDAPGRQLTPEDQARLEKEQRVLSIWSSIPAEHRREWITSAILAFEGSDVEKYRPSRILQEFKAQVDRLTRLLNSIDTSGGIITEEMRIEIDDLGERAVSMITQRQLYED